MHVLEVMIGGMLIVGALQASVDMTQHSEQSESGTEELRTLGNDALRTLYLLPVSGTGVDPDDYGNSSLVLSVAGNRTGILTDFLNVTLPAQVSFRVSVDHYSLVGGEIVPVTSVLFQGPDVLGETARTHFLFHHNGEVYDLHLLMWFLSREVGA